MFSIPSDINTLSTADTFVCYRDTVGLHVYPVYPPWAKQTKDPGKQPAIEKWWDEDPHDCDLEKYFKIKYPFNIGASPKPPVAFIDLDSKPDRGASVREYLASHPELEKIPSHASRGGGHLVVICADLPVFLKPNGNEYMEPLFSQLTEKVTAELFYHPHQNLVLPCSLHPVRDNETDPYFVYRRERTGEIPRVPWQWLQDTFGFKPPEFKSRGRPTKQPAWYLQFHGDLSSLNLIALLEELGHPPEAANVDEGKYAVLCPWHTEHSNDNVQIDGTSAVVWQPPEGEGWPGFKCKHSHCESAGRSLKELLEWAESKVKGIVDRHCARERVWDRSAQVHTGKKGLPRVLHAEGRLESTVYTEVGQLIAPHHAWFNRGGQVVRIKLIPSGYSYSADPKSRYKIKAFTPGFRELTGIQAKGLLEKYMEPGVLEERDDQVVFIPKSFTTDFCAGLVKSDQLESELDHISRILPVPLPIRVDQKLVYPCKGFDQRFGTYLLSDAPELDLAMPIQEAWKWIAWILRGFCFTGEQARTHAIARMLTPFARAILGWTTRVPLWIYIGSRPRCGKDYLSGCTLIIYEGQAYEDQAISGRDTAPETGKRILSAGRNGRRFMHFSNCPQNLKDNSLTQAVTMPYISGRNLGTNDAAADVTIPNEMEYSVSFNLGLTISDDLGPRARPIELAFYEEDPNSRTFPDPHLHRTLKDSRAKILSAFAAIFRQWEEAGFPKGPTPFASFIEWGEIIGGVMLANRPQMYEALSPIPAEDGVVPKKTDKPPEGWGDPCLPWGGKFADAAADRKTMAMRSLFIACAATFGEKLVHNKSIFECVIKHQRIDDGGGEENEQPSDEKSSLTDTEIDALSYFGLLDSVEGAHGNKDAHSNKTRLMSAVRAFNGRVLAGIKLKIHPADRAARNLYQFVRQSPPPQDTTTRCETTRGGNGPDTPKTPPVAPKMGVEINLDMSEPSASGDDSIDSSTPDPGKHRRQNTTTALALDLETFAEPKIGRTGRITPTSDALDPRKAEIRLVTIGDEDGNLRQFDLRGSPQLPPEIMGALCGESEIVIHNASFELLFLQTKLGILPEHIFCTLTAARLLDPQKSVSHSLGPVIERYLGVKLSKEHGSSDWGSMMLTPEQLQYARDDVRYLLRLREILAAKLKEAGLLEVFYMEIQLLPVIARMELHGFEVDTARLQSMLAEQKQRAGNLEKDIRCAFDEEQLNPASPEQLLAAFKKFGFQLEDTEEKTLRAIDDDHEAAALILVYRGAAKLASSIEGLLEAQCEGRIYARFNPLGAVTGRFSSKGPNLQNITRGPLRSCFIPSSSERRLIIADYSQIELRVAALVAGESVMIEAFRAGKDLHKKTASAVLRKAEDEVSRDDRQLAKACAFGLLYGQGAEGFMVYARTQYELVIEPRQATLFKTSFFETYPALRAWHKDCWRKAKDRMAEARTIYGRLLRAQADTDWARFNLWTEYVISGSCADLLKAAMVKIASILPSDVHLVATVHDELIYDAPLDLAEQYRGMIRHAMEEVFVEMFGTAVPIEVEAKVCTNWGEK